MFPFIDFREWRVQRKAVLKVRRWDAQWFSCTNRRGWSFVTAARGALSAQASIGRALTLGWRVCLGRTWIVCLTSMFRLWRRVEQKIEEGDRFPLGFRRVSFIPRLFYKHCPLLTLFCQEMKFMRLLERSLPSRNTVTARLRGQGPGMGRPDRSVIPAPSARDGWSGPLEGLQQPALPTNLSRCVAISNRQS